MEQKVIESEDYIGIRGKITIDSWYEEVKSGVFRVVTTNVL